MRSALICVFFVLIVHKEGSHAANFEDFNPTPIPLNEWNSIPKDEKAGTLQEIIATETPPAVAVVPAHYWEDALRHSVYLTLVRDKIDQLIAQGSVISPDSKPDIYASREVDDHNLWEKIKAAPFDRLNPDEPATLGDITIMSKGRLLEDNDGYRFTEDEKSKEKCNEEKCNEGVKAYWSVKRVRQRDAETVPGKYHYELTFSVISQTQKQYKKPYDNPVRTFTVRESNAVEGPQVRIPEPVRLVSHATRPQRAIWFHKNINQSPPHQSRKTSPGFDLDRLFFSWFTDDDDVPPPKYRPNNYSPHGHPVHSKVGYSGNPQDQYHKKVPQYHHKPPSYNKYPRPLPGPHGPGQGPPHIPPQGPYGPPHGPPQGHHGPPPGPHHGPHHSLSQNPPQIPPVAPPLASPLVPPLTQPLIPPISPPLTAPPTPSVIPPLPPSAIQPLPVPALPAQYPQFTDYEIRNPFSNAPNDYRHSPTNVIKTTKPAVLPTPTLSFPTLNITMDFANVLNVTEPTTKEPELITYKVYTKSKPSPTKVSYFPDHVRPPVFNAPPGVFATMDKKPFKPMPPLKMSHPMKHHPHMHKHKPVDFRPSPQVLDVQFSDPDPLTDAFRPMAMSYADRNTTEASVTPIKYKGSSKPKPSKKHENVKTHRTTTTVAPEIITANNLAMEQISLDSMQWANNILGAFTKTTPMASYKTPTESTTPDLFPLIPVTSEISILSSETDDFMVWPSTSAMPLVKKRTRPPPKFKKQEKIKKHKRTTTTTTTTTTTYRPPSKRPLKDLTPDASSAATGNTKPTWQQTTTTENDTATTTPMTSNETQTTTTSTTTRPTTTTRSTTTTTRSTTPRETTTTESKPRNRFRQSTLLIKGTSVKHDKWSSPNVSALDRAKTVIPLSMKAQGRRKASNFQGYGSSTQKPANDDSHRENHEDNASDSYLNEISSTGERTTFERTKPKDKPDKQQTTNTDISESTEDGHREEMEISEISQENDGESKDQNEYIFSVTTVRADENSNEVIGQEVTAIPDTVVASPHSAGKNKTKCKKKKNNSTITEEPVTSSNDSVVNASMLSAEEEPSEARDIFSEILDLSGDGEKNDNDKENDNFYLKSDLSNQPSANYEQYSKLDDDFEKFLDSLTGKKNENDSRQHYDDDEDIDDDGDDDEESNEYSSNKDKDESKTSKQLEVGYDDYHDRPYSLLELMAME